MRATEERDFRRFAEATAPTLLPVAGALTGSRPAAERLVFMALTGIARRWRRIDGDLTGHATRLLYRAHTSRRGGVPLDLHPLSPPGLDLDDPSDPEPRLRHAALRQLDARSRALLTLRYLQGSDAPETSRTLAIPIESVEAGTAEALDRVRSLRASLSGPGSPPDRSGIETEVRETLAELAAAVEPADTAGLAGAALAATDRHRRARVGAVAGAAVVVVMLAVGLGPAVLRGSPDLEQADVDLTGLAVVTGYEDGEWYVLDPDTGDYRHWPWGPGDISPDLRTVVNSSVEGGETVFELRSTTDLDRAPVTVPLPDGVSAPRWSPDSARIAGQLEIEADPVLRRVAVLEAATGQLTMVDLRLPPDRAGSLATGLFWLEPDRLAVPTGDAEAVRAHILDERPDLPIDAVSVFDLTGAQVGELPVHQYTEPGRPGWLPRGQLADGRFVLSRESGPPEADPAGPGPETVDLAAVDLATDPGPYPQVTLQLAPPSDGDRWSLTGTGWFGTTVYVEAVLVRYVEPPPGEEDQGGFYDVLGQTIAYLVDLETGETGLVHPPARFGLPVADEAAVGTLGFGDAAGLAPAAAHRAFPP